MENTEKKTCCICGKPFEGFGNNPEPITPGEKASGELNNCCNWCNAHIVVPERFRIRELIDYAAAHSEPVSDEDMTDETLRALGAEDVELEPSDAEDIERAALTFNFLSSILETETDEPQTIN